MTVAVTATGCGGSSNAGGSSNGSGSTGGDVLVGYTGDLSGVFAISGSGALKGIQSYIAEVNGEGGIDGRKVKLIALDDAGDPTRALTNIQKLLTQNHVQAMLGSTISGLCEAAEKSLAAAKMPIVCTAAGPTQVSPPSPSKWVYQAQAGQDHMVAPVVDLIKKVEPSTPKPKVAYIYYDSASHIGFSKAFEPTLKQLDWALTDVEKVPLVANPPVRELATKIANSKPDVVVSFMVDSTAKVFYETLRSQGYKGPIIQDPDTGVSILNDVKDPSIYILTHEYVTNVASDHIDGDAAYNKMTTSVEKFGTKTSVSYVPRGYLNAMTLINAMKSCKLCTGAKLADAIAGETVPSNGITPGDLKFSADNHSGAQEMPAYSYRDGSIQLFANHLKIGMTPN
jgi:branched-chain amino acid transport system substrate-binding protein